MNFRHRVTIKSDSSPDGELDPTYDNTVWSSLPCNINPVSGGETYRGRQIEATTNFVIETRYVSGIDQSMIAVNDVDSTQMNIGKIHDLNLRGRYLMIEATTVNV